jgi:hypothetical protein
MAGQEVYYYCERCRAPASHYVADVREEEPEVDGRGIKWIRLSVHSVHSFCRQHTRSSLYYPRSQPRPIQADPLAADAPALVEPAR